MATTTHGDLNENHLLILCVDILHKFEFLEYTRSDGGDRDRGELGCSWHDIEDTTVVLLLNITNDLNDQLLCREG
jgi:hypothetical protein